MWGSTSSQLAPPGPREPAADEACRRSAGARAYRRRPAAAVLAATPTTPDHHDWDDSWVSRLPPLIKVGPSSLRPLRLVCASLPPMKPLPQVQGSPCTPTTVGRRHSDDGRPPPWLRRLPWRRWISRKLLWLKAVQQNCNSLAKVTDLEKLKDQVYHKLSWTNVVRVNLCCFQLTSDVCVTL
jgi:hypothetical protein